VGSRPSDSPSVQERDDAMTCEVCGFLPCDRAVHLDDEDRLAAGLALRVAELQRQLHAARNRLHWMMEQDPGWSIPASGRQKAVTSG